MRLCSIVFSGLFLFLLGCGDQFNTQSTVITKEDLKNHHPVYSLILPDNNYIVPKKKNLAKFDESLSRAPVIL